MTSRISEVAFDIAIIFNLFQISISSFEIIEIIRIDINESRQGMYVYQYLAALASSKAYDRWELWGVDREYLFSRSVN
jgi:hypothetical protein